MSVWQMQTETRLNNIESNFQTAFKRISKLESRLGSLRRQFSAAETKKNKAASRRSSSNTITAEFSNRQGTNKMREPRMKANNSTCSSRSDQIKGGTGRGRRGDEARTGDCQAPPSSSDDALHVALDELRAANGIMRCRISLLEDAIQLAKHQKQHQHQPYYHHQKIEKEGKKRKEEEEEEGAKQYDHAPQGPTISRSRYICRNCFAVTVGMLIIICIIASIPMLIIGVSCFQKNSVLCPSWMHHQQQNESYLLEMIQMGFGGSCLLIFCISCYWCCEDPVRYIFGIGFFAFDVCTQLTIDPKHKPGDFVFDAFPDTWNYEPIHI
mmetsp:Transcript_27304/g.38104  ORF Transcript_27304/g.38104 Transcript_27304/m.38104 type:complete len:325 (+) Transcript_27304:127-1101(+)